MKYLENNDPIGIVPADDGVAKMIMENLGIEPEAQETPNLIGVGDELFALSPEITVIEDQLCIKLDELSDELFESVKDNPELTEYVEFEETNYQFNEVVEADDGSFYVTLTEGDVEVDEEAPEEQMQLEVNGKTYNVVEDSENAETFAYLAEDENGEYYLVDSEEDATNIVYMNEVE